MQYTYTYNITSCCEWFESSMDKGAKCNGYFQAMMYHVVFLEDSSQSQVFQWSDKFDYFI
jgi:hypothetical protein